MSEINSTNNLEKEICDVLLEMMHVNYPIIDYQYFNGELITIFTDKNESVVCVLWKNKIPIILEKSSFLSFLKSDNKLFICSKKYITKNGVEFLDRNGFENIEKLRLYQVQDDKLIDVNISFPISYRVNIINQEYIEIDCNIYEIKKSKKVKIFDFSKVLTYYIDKIKTVFFVTNIYIVVQSYGVLTFIERNTQKFLFEIDVGTNNVFKLNSENIILSDENGKKSICEIVDISEEKEDLTEIEYRENETLEEGLARIERKQKIFESKKYRNLLPKKLLKKIGDFNE